MKNPLVWLALVIIVAGAGSLYYWRSTTGAPEPKPPVATAAPPAIGPPVASAAAPAIAHPLPPATNTPPLPPLADSDASVQAALVEMFGRESFARFFVPDALVRNFVVTIDNLPRKTAAARLRPVRPVPGPFAATSNGASFDIGTDNALRYRPYLVAMEQVEAKRLVNTYVRLYPLFQSAYQELGYPNGYFNDRLVQAIDDLLATPEVPSPQLAQPKVLYEFTDAALEDRSAGQKIMLRMGNANAARVKDKLRAIRREILAQAPAS